MTAPPNLITFFLCPHSRAWRAKIWAYYLSPSRSLLFSRSRFKDCYMAPPRICQWLCRPHQAAKKPWSCVAPSPAELGGRRRVSGLDSGRLVQHDTFSTASHPD